MQTPQDIRLAQTSATDPRVAAEEFHASVSQPDMALVVFFCSKDYDLNLLEAEINRLFSGVPVVGCTTAGEIGPHGYCEHTLAGASFSGAAFTAVTGHLDLLQQFSISEGEAFAQRLLHELADKAPHANDQNSFAFLMIDGMSIREEPVARALQNALGKLPLVGGSAGDGLNFGDTHVYADGSFQSGRAAMILVTTRLPFRVFKTQHFVPTEQRLVITQADAAQRIVSEINGLPAAQEYARLVGVNVQDATPGRFAASPVVVIIDSSNYVRSIQKANSDDSLTFFCAIEEGLVLRVARGVNLVENLEQTLAEIRADIGTPQLILSCDCILRRLEVVQNHLEEHVGSILRSHNVIGFNTYGEQFLGIHVNQTLTGVAIGSSAGGS